jgi:hypothetical protein
MSEKHFLAWAGTPVENTRKIAQKRQLKKNLGVLAGSTMEIDWATAPWTEKNQDRETAAELNKEPRKQVGVSAQESTRDEGKSDLVRAKERGLDITLWT